MKIRYILLLLLVALQLGWLGVQYFRTIAEIHAAQHVTVPAVSHNNFSYFETHEPRYARYTLDHYTTKALRRFKNSKELTFTMEVSLRENQQAYATALFVNGVPIRKAVSDLYNGDTPAPKP